MRRYGETRLQRNNRQEIDDDFDSILQDEDDAAVSSLLKKVQKTSGLANMRRERLLKNAEYHKPNNQQPNFENYEQEPKQSMKTTPSAASLFSTLESLKEKSDNTVQQKSSFVPMKSEDPARIFKKHFRQERLPSVEVNDMDDKWTRYVVEHQECTPETIRKYTSFIEVDEKKLSEEEEIKVYSQGYKEWLNPDHKQNNMLTPLGDISQLKTISRPFTPSPAPSIEEKLGIIDNTKSIIADNPMNSLPSVTWQKNLAKSGDERFSLSSITFTGEHNDDMEDFKSYIDDGEELILDIEEIEKMAMKDEEAYEKYADRLLCGEDNEDDLVVTKKDKPNETGVVDQESEEPFFPDFSKIKKQVTEEEFFKKQFETNPQMKMLQENYNEFMRNMSPQTSINAMFSKSKKKPF